MCTCLPRFFEYAQHSFDVALRSFLECIVNASGLGFNDRQWRLATLPFAFGGLGVYSRNDVLNYVFLASRSQSVGLQAKLLRHTGIVAFGSIFDDELFKFNTSMETNLLTMSEKKISYLDSLILASHLQSVGLQTKLLRHTGIIASGPIFDDVLFEFNTSMKTDFLSNSINTAWGKTQDASFKGKLTY
ncbi:hypothetical protein Tco_0972740 [Tanacetum coccineum]